MDVATAERTPRAGLGRDALGLVGRRAVWAGLVGGVVGVYLALVGIVERFDDREMIADLITLGYTMYVITGLLAGYLASRPRMRAGEPVPQPAAVTLAAGAGSGLIGGLVMAGFLVLADASQPTIRTIFVSASPRLQDLLQFGLSLGPGVLIVVVAGVGLGLVGSSLRLLRPRDRRALLLGGMVTLLISLLEPFLRVMLVGLSERVGSDAIETFARWLYESGGLSLWGAVAVLGVTTGASMLSARKGAAARGRLQALPTDQRRRIQAVLLLVVVGVLLTLPFLVGSFLSEVLGSIGLFVLLGLGLNIVVGYAGLLDLGYVAFFAVGAYSTAVLSSPDTQLAVELSFWPTVPIVMAVAALAGVLIGAPVLRLRGDYLAIVTLGFGEIARVLVQSDMLAPWLGGAQGIIKIPEPTLGGLAFRDPESLYYLILGFCLVAIYISWRLATSRVGRAWNAMREDEQVAEAMGVSIVKYKLLAFSMGAVIGSFSGAFFAVKIGSIFPNSFEILVSITALALIILGGMGSIPGVIVGATVLVGLPELLREFAEFRLLLYGAILVAIMILRPQGLIPNVRRARELHEEELEQDQWARKAGAETPEPVITGGSTDGRKS
jgi:branched-chain amino acid transport system permease protein